MMFDQMVWKTRIPPDVQKHVVRELSMRECTKGEIVFYESSEFGNFEDMHARLEGDRLSLRFSCHKLWSLWTTGRLDNSGVFTFSDAVATVRTLASMLRLELREIKCEKFEIGVSWKMPREPILYISDAVSIGPKNKEMFIDANWYKNRQKTTSRVRAVKKVFKIYDKSFEYDSKGKEVEPGILRIETIFRRQSARLDELISDDNISRLRFRFFEDWSSMVFIRDVRGRPGTKASQLEKARGIMAEGLHEYRERNRQAYRERAITKKMWETVREFCDGWSSRYQCLFETVPGQAELEYAEMLQRVGEII